MDFPFPLYLMEDYAGAFEAWADRMDAPKFAAIVPASRVPEDRIPSEVGIDGRELLGCLSRYEGRIPEAIEFNGLRIAEAGDWLLIYG